MVFVAAGCVRDGGQDELQSGTVQSGQAVTEVDGGVGGTDRRGDPQESLFTSGQAGDLLRDGGEVDPLLRGRWGESMANRVRRIAR